MIKIDWWVLVLFFAAGIAMGFGAGVNYPHREPVYFSEEQAKEAQAAISRIRQNYPDQPAPETPEALSKQTATYFGKGVSIEQAKTYTINGQNTPLECGHSTAFLLQIKDGEKKVEICMWCASVLLNRLAVREQVNLLNENFIKALKESEKK